MSICLNSTPILFSICLHVFIYVLKFILHIWNNFISLYSELKLSPWAGTYHSSYTLLFSLLGSNDKNTPESVSKFVQQMDVKKTHLCFTWKRRELSAWPWLMSVNVGLFFSFFVVIPGGEKHVWMLLIYCQILLSQQLIVCFL